MNNTAGIEGGAIKWNFYEPLMRLDNKTFSGNKAGVYGDDIACVAKYLNITSSSSENKSLAMRRNLLELDGV